MQLKFWRAGVLPVLLLSVMTLGLAAPAVADSAKPAPVPSATAGVSLGDGPQSLGGVPIKPKGIDKNGCTISGNVAACFKTGKGSTSKPKQNSDNTGGVQPYTMQNWPQWCLDNGADAGWYGTRTQLCAINSGSLTIKQVVNGVPGVTTGVINFLVYNYIYMDTTLNTWAYQIRVSPTSITGTAVGTTIYGVASCVGANCNQTSQSFPTQTPGVMGNADGEAYWSWTGASTQSASGTPTWDFYMKAPVMLNTVDFGQSAPVPVRCDNAVPGFATIGCVVPAIIPGIYYYKSSYPEFSAHVMGAQASGLRGGSVSNPLHRLVNQAAQDLNRSTACPNSYPRPSGKDCDEYPFSSTTEGAAFSGGGPRTQSWCQITLSGAPSTGSAGYSVCMIDSSENRSAGSVLNSVLYVPARVIDNDAFYVSFQ